MEVDDAIKLTPAGGKAKLVVWKVEGDHRPKLDKMGCTGLQGSTWDRIRIRLASHTQD